MNTNDTKPTNPETPSLTGNLTRRATLAGAFAGMLTSLPGCGGGSDSERTGGGGADDANYRPLTEGQPGAPDLEQEQINPKAVANEPGYLNSRPNVVPVNHVNREVYHIEVAFNTNCRAKVEIEYAKNSFGAPETILLASRTVGSGHDPVSFATMDTGATWLFTGGLNGGPVYGAGGRHTRSLWNQSLRLIVTLEGDPLSTPQHQYQRVGGLFDQGYARRFDDLVIKDHEWLFSSSGDAASHSNWAVAVRFIFERDMVTHGYTRTLPISEHVQHRRLRSTSDAPTTYTYPRLYSNNNSEESFAAAAIDKVTHSTDQAVAVVSEWLGIPNIRSAKFFSPVQTREMIQPLINEHDTNRHSRKHTTRRLAAHMSRYAVELDSVLERSDEKFGENLCSEFLKCIIGGDAVTEVRKTLNAIKRNFEDMTEDNLEGLMDFIQTQVNQDTDSRSRSLKEEVNSRLPDTNTVTRAARVYIGALTLQFRLSGHYTSPTGKLSTWFGFDIEQVGGLRLNLLIQRHGVASALIDGVRQRSEKSYRITDALKPGGNGIKFSVQFIYDAQAAGEKVWHGHTTGEGSFNLTINYNNNGKLALRIDSFTMEFVFSYEFSNWIQTIYKAMREKLGIPATATTAAFANNYLPSFSLTAAQFATAPIAFLVGSERSLFVEWVRNMFYAAIQNAQNWFERNSEVKTWKQTDFIIVRFSVVNTDVHNKEIVGFRSGWQGQGQCVFASAFKASASIGLKLLPVPISRTSDVAKISGYVRLSYNADSFFLIGGSRVNALEIALATGAAMGGSGT